MATVDLSKCTPEQRKQYSRIAYGAGKGDGIRNIWSKAFRTNYDLIFKKRDRKTTQNP